MMGFRILMAGSGLLLLTLLAAVLWFILIPLGLVALVYYANRTRKAVAKAKVEFAKFIDETHKA